MEIGLKANKDIMLRGVEEKEGNRGMKPRRKRQGSSGKGC